MDNTDNPPRNPDAEEALIRAALTPAINHRLRSARIVARRAVIVAEAGDLSAVALDGFPSVEAILKAGRVMPPGQP